MSAAVAFGMRALMCALKACEQAVTPRDLDDLDALRLDALPQRDDLAAMCARFRAGCEAGQSCEAGRGLMDELSQMSGGETERIADDMARTQAALAAAGVADWQQRRDMQ